MAKSQFEEKQFEGPINNALLGGGNFLFSPGQVLEAVVGFDAAMFTTNLAFWSMWSGANGIPPGTAPKRKWWSPAPKKASLPPFSLNLFLQYKRPDHMETANAREWSAWNRRYYRYNVDDPVHQLTALCCCASGLGPQGVVLYAAPAFWTLKQLWKHVAANDLVQHSNFVEATALAEHTRWTYTTGGKTGKAHSEVEEVRCFDFGADLPPRRVASSQNGRGVFEVAADAARTTVARTGFPLPSNDRLSEIERTVVGVLAENDVSDPETLATCGHYSVAAAFCAYAGLGWLIG